ncbi:hypothetical protein DYBT9275_00380 [Dyadobacter sp. CECT 9275]|uniref:Uncharacterized protein n=1 Tax=Dyadobacter helix TaxID=2822344 RepID=A0A916NAT0_9BACT|nr:hypothetical protein [Dyadobacter sp. CECT 9275]CAG4989784.1 hypothetical protein DYBT9275_00380 [Dyadobacter sp. CECT 9275]
MYHKKLFASLFLALLFLSIFFLKDRFQIPPYQDEFHYLATAIQFSKEPFPSLCLLTSYGELNTPIPFILGGWVVHLLGEDLLYLRILTSLFSFSLLMLFIWNSPDKSRRFWVCLLGLLLFPNYYLVSVYYYTDIFAMFFVLAGIVTYLRKAHWAGMLLFVAAVSCRQYMLAFPAAIVAFEIIPSLLKTGQLKALPQQLADNRVWLYYVAAVLSIVPWMMLWNGPAPAPVMAEQYYTSDKLIQYNFGFVLYASAVVAAYYVIPEMLFTGKFRYYLTYPVRYPKIFTAFFIFTITLAIGFPARQTYNPYFTWPYLGYLDQGLVAIGITGLMKQIIFALLMLLTCMRFITPPFNLASWIVVINILILGKAQLSWDKYSLPLIMALWFLAMFDQHQHPVPDDAELEPELMEETK